MNKYYLYEDIKQDRNVKYDKPKRSPGVIQVGFDKNDPKCQQCTGYGNQLFMCHYCENYDHFYKREKRQCQ